MHPMQSACARVPGDAQEPWLTLVHVAHPTRSSTNTVLSLAAGIVLLGLMVAFTVGLPHVTGDNDSAGGSGGDAAAALPATLAGGWTALVPAGKGDDASASPSADPSADPSAAASDEDQNRAALAYVNATLDKVYDESTQFQAYVSKAGDQIVTATLFDAAGGAFAPPNGVADPTSYGLDRAPVELTRVGDAVCIANYQSGTPSGGAEQPADPTPLAVSCQEQHAGSTVQLGSTQMSVDDTVKLLDDVVGRLSA